MKKIKTFNLIFLAVVVSIFALAAIAFANTQIDVVLADTQNPTTYYTGKNQMPEIQGYEGTVYVYDADLVDEDDDTNCYTGTPFSGATDAGEYEIYIEQGSENIPLRFTISKVEVRVECEDIVTKYGSKEPISPTIKFFGNGAEITDSTLKETYFEKLGELSNQQNYTEQESASANGKELSGTFAHPTQNFEIKGKDELTGKVPYLKPSTNIDSTVAAKYFVNKKELAVRFETPSNLTAGKVDLGDIAISTTGAISNQKVNLNVVYKLNGEVVTDLSKAGNYTAELSIATYANNYELDKYEFSFTVKPNLILVYILVPTALVLIAGITILSIWLVKKKQYAFALAKLTREKTSTTGKLTNTNVFSQLRKGADTNLSGTSFSREQVLAEVKRIKEEKKKK